MVSEHNTKLEGVFNNFSGQNVPEASSEFRSENHMTSAKICTIICNFRAIFKTFLLYGCKKQKYIYFFHLFRSEFLAEKQMAAVISNLLPYM